MVLSPGAICYLVALILFVVSAWPGASNWPLVSIGLAFLAGGHLLG